MKKHLRSGMLILLTVFISHTPAFPESMVSFDFDHIQTQSKKGVLASDIEIYMEGLYGSDISVSQNATAVRSVGKTILNFPNSPSASLNGNDAYLKVGRGRGPSGIALDFGANPIDSFNVDWRIFKGGKSFTILADGVVIDQHTLSKAQRKSGLTGHQDTYYFDTPVHKLEFIGINKKSFAIDNLTINIPLPGDDETEDVGGLDEQSEGGSSQSGSQSNSNGNNPPYDGTGPLDQPTGSGNISINQVTADVPEPSSLLLLAAGLCGAWFSRRVVTQ